MEKLKDFRKGIQEDNQRYLDEHPEIHRLIDDFIAATISQKPADLVKFGAFYFNNLKNSKGIGHCPVIFAGPSGVGKGTLVNRLMETFPSIFGFSVSHTTRAPREGCVVIRLSMWHIIYAFVHFVGEQDGVHYHFVGRADMEDLIENGKFIEFARVHTNTYGTSFKAVEKVRIEDRCNYPCRSFY